MEAAPAGASIRRIIGSYDSTVIRAYALCRFAILRPGFLDEIGQYLPREGRVLDLGCGFGLFSLYFAASAPARSLLGVDIDAGRVDAARASAARLGLDNARYEVGDALAWSADRGPYDAIYMLDMVHHTPPGLSCARSASRKARTCSGGV